MFRNAWGILRKRAMDSECNPRTLTAEDRGFYHGLGWPFRGASFLCRNRGVKRYVLLAIIANMFLYFLSLAVLLWLLWKWQPAATAWDFWGPVGSWLTAAYNTVAPWMRWIVFLVALLLSYFTFTAVGMVVASPLNDMLSEKVELLAANRRAEERRLGESLKITGASLVDSMYMSAWQLVLTAVFFPFVFIPVVGFLPLFIVGAYFGSRSFVIPAPARHGLRLRDMRALFRRRRWELLGFGTTMQLLFMIPFAGMVILPVGVTAGTLFYCKYESEGVACSSGPTGNRDKR